MIRRFALLALFCILSGCSVTRRLPSATPPGVNVIVWSDLDPIGREEWIREAARRFPGGCTVLFCHGLASENKTEWRLAPADTFIHPEAQSIAYALVKVYHRPLVLICCNPNGQPIFVRDVLYSYRNVWQRPGPTTQPVHGKPEEADGHLDQFRESPVIVSP